jgi:hypothetical protein
MNNGEGTEMSLKYVMGDFFRKRKGFPRGVSGGESAGQNLSFRFFSRDKNDHPANLNFHS